MFNGSNCGQKSQLSGILTEPLNPREVSIILYSFIENGPVYVHQLMFFNDLLPFFSHIHVFSICQDLLFGCFLV